MIRKLTLMVMVLTSAMSARTLAAQSPAAPKVGEMGFFAGVWKGKGEMRDGPSSPFKAISGGETCRWAAGGAALVCEEKETGPGGGWTGIYLLGYEEKQDTYTLYGIESPGTVVRGTGKLENGVWLWTVENVTGGSSSPARYTFRADGKNSRIMLVEAPDASGKWFTVANHRYTRTSK
jgi:hypothetical protein